MRKTFHDFVNLREATGAGTRTELKLGKDNDFKPFHVDKSHYPNLRILVQAFANSDQIPIDNEIDSASGGTKDITMKKKNLFLVGGAVRDHLTGKTPKDFDLVTDATPPQIRRVLKAAGFNEIKNAKGKRHPQGKDNALPNEPALGKANKVFWAGGWDGTGTDVHFLVRVNGEEFELATLRSNHKGENGDVHDKVSFGGIDQDADRRDFTINAMYIPLDTADGPNAKLIDLHGGIHHLKSGNVNPIGNFRDRLDEDPLRALRYIRFIARFSKGDKIPPEHQAAIEEIKDFRDISPERIKAEFVHGLEHPDVDPRKYIKLYQSLGLIDKVFPNVEFELNVPEDFSDKKDRILSVAWILRNNDPTKVSNMLSAARWDNREVNDITYLISLYHWGVHSKFNSVFLADMKSKMIKTSLVPSKVRTWGQMAGLDMDAINRFLHQELPVKGSTITPGGSVQQTKGPTLAGSPDPTEDDMPVDSFKGMANRISAEKQDPKSLAPKPSAEDDLDGSDQTPNTEDVLKTLWGKLIVDGKLPTDENF